MQGLGVVYMERLCAGTRLGSVREIVQPEAAQKKNFLQKQVAQVEGGWVLRFLWRTR